MFRTPPGGPSSEPADGQTVTSPGPSRSFVKCDVDRVWIVAEIEEAGRQWHDLSVGRNKLQFEFG